jgi:hypothetical protein
MIGRATKLQGKATRTGVWKCNEKECRKQFTVKKHPQITQICMLRNIG